jgi:hypothetical protein
MKKALLVFFAVTTLFSSSAQATTINFFTTPLGGSSWRHEYTIMNDSLTTAIEEFTIFFDHSLFSNLAIASSPTDWDSIVIQPDPALPATGFFDSLALFGALAPGASLGGFSVTFMYAGFGNPGSQLFDIVDPQTFAVLDSGLTARIDLAEPGSLPLLLLAIFLTVISVRMRSAGRRYR